MSGERRRTKAEAIWLQPSFFWSECGDLNSGPLGPEPSALPAALHPVKLCYYKPYFQKVNRKNKTIFPTILSIDFCRLLCYNAFIDDFTLRGSALRAQKITMLLKMIFTLRGSALRAQKIVCLIKAQGFLCHRRRDGQGGPRRGDPRRVREDPPLPDENRDGAHGLRLGGPGIWKRRQQLGNGPHQARYQPDPRNL